MLSGNLLREWLQRSAAAYLGGAVAMCREFELAPQLPVWVRGISNLPPAPARTKLADGQIDR